MGKWCVYFIKLKIHWNMSRSQVPYSPYLLIAFAQKNWYQFTHMNTSKQNKDQVECWMLFSNECDHVGYFWNHIHSERNSVRRFIYWKGSRAVQRNVNNSIGIWNLQANSLHAPSAHINISTKIRTPTNDKMSEKLWHILIAFVFVIWKWYF